MSYITRNANLLLLFLVVLIAASLVGATVYYQDRFGDLNQEYTQKKAELENLTRQVNEYQDFVEKAELELELKQNREEEFTEKFTEEKARAEQLEQTKEQLEEDLLQAKATIRTQDEQLDDFTSQVASLKADLNTANRKINNLEEEVECLEDSPDEEEGDC